MIDFVKVLATINEIRDMINGLDFDQAGKKLAGYNCDGTLFDYDYPIDETYYIVGTIDNNNGKPVINDYCLYVVWDKHEQVLSMTESEIKEQIERLK